MGSDLAEHEFRRRVLDRDGECQYCGTEGEPLNRLEAHHVEPQSEGGETTMENGITICERHHAILHSLGSGGEYPVGVLDEYEVPKEVPGYAPVNDCATVMVLNVLRDEYQVNPRRIRDVTGLERQRVNDALNALENAGWIEKRARGLYRLVYDGEAYVEQEIVRRGEGGENA